MTETELQELKETRRQAQSLLDFWTDAAQDDGTMSRNIKALEAKIEVTMTQRDELLRKQAEAPDKIASIKSQLRAIDIKMSMHQSGLLEKADSTALKLQQALEELARLRAQLTPATGTGTESNSSVNT